MYIGLRKYGRNVCAYIVNRHIFTRCWILNNKGSVPDTSIVSFSRHCWTGIIRLQKYIYSHSGNLMPPPRMIKIKAFNTITIIKSWEMFVRCSYAFVLYRFTFDIGSVTSVISLRHSALYFVADRTANALWYELIIYIAAQFHAFNKDPAAAIDSSNLPQVERWKCKGERLDSMPIVCFLSPIDKCIIFKSKDLRSQGKASKSIWVK